MPSGTVMAVAHRGASAYTPENTLAAFEEAIRLGARAIECDVRLSADGVPVIFHDDTLDRTTNSRGLLRTRTAAELSRLDAGGWFGERFRGVGVPTLDEALGVMLPGAMPVLELKTAIDPSALGTSLARHGRLESALVISFVPEWIGAVRRSNRAFRTGFLADTWTDDLPSRTLALGADVLVLSVDVLTLQRVSEADDAGLDVWCYTANDIGLVAACAAMGVTGIITDRPDLIRHK